MTPQPPALPPSGSRHAWYWKPRSGTIITALGTVSLAVGIVGYFAGPVPAMLPGPWGTWASIAGLAFILVTGVISLWLLASRFSTQLQRVVDARLAKSHKDILRILEEATASQAGAEQITLAMLELSAIVHDLQTSCRNITASNDPSREARMHTHQALTRFARVFTTLNGVEMRASVKLVRISKEQRPRRIAVTFARSNTTELDPADRFDPIESNTDFQAIILGQRTWHSNRISAEPNYQNSSPNRKYESVLVWGIRDIGINSYPEAIIGFLCIDSVEPDAIEVRRDSQLGWWLVDAFRTLYNYNPDAFALDPPPSPQSRVG